MPVDEVLILSCLTKKPIVVTIPVRQLYIHQLGLEQGNTLPPQVAPLFPVGCLGVALLHLSGS